MVTQLGLVNFFVTLDYDNLHRNKLISIIVQFNGENLYDNDIDKTDFFGRCTYLNLNPVLLALHFQYRVHFFFFFLIIVVDEPWSTYQTIRVEFQLCRRPHVYSFLWIIDIQTLGTNDVNEYTQFIYAIVKAYVPGVNENTERFHLVKIYQVHSH